MTRISARAQAAMDAVEHYPFGDVREWAERNWNEAVRPFMDEFIAAVKNKSAAVDEGYFAEMSPAFLFFDVKAMHGMSIGIQGKTPMEKSEIMSRVFFPFGQKWTELLTAIQRRIGVCAEVRVFKTKLALVADAIKLMFAESGLEAHADTIWDLRRGMIEAFSALLDRVCSIAPADLPRTGRYARYCYDNETLRKKFGVSVKTVIRWKNENDQTQHAIAFRGVRESCEAMDRLAEHYRLEKENREIAHNRVVVEYSDAIDYSRRRR